MTKKVFHIYNVFILLLLLAFNSFALFGAGMSEGGVYSYMWFATGLSFFIWGIFYFIQFVRSNRAWRISWFIIMVTLLFFWQTGLGAKAGLFIM